MLKCKDQFWYSPEHIANIYVVQSFFSFMSVFNLDHDY